MVTNKYTESSSALAIENTNQLCVFDKLVEELIEQIPLADFTEAWGFESITQEVDYEDYFLTYQIRGAFERELASGNQWHTKHFEVEVNDLILYDGEGDEICLTPSQLEQIKSHIQNHIEL